MQISEIGKSFIDKTLCFLKISNKNTSEELGKILGYNVSDTQGSYFIDAGIYQQMTSEEKSLFDQVEPVYNQNNNKN